MRRFARILLEPPRKRSKCLSGAHVATQDWAPPPGERFKEIVSLGENGLRNCPITVSDVSNAPVIIGPNRPRIRGATTRDTKVLRVKEQRVAIPRMFYKMHKMVTITADVMFINGILFLVTFSRKIKFRTAKYAQKKQLNP